MHSAIVTVHDSKRGCGWRKAGGFYFRSDGAGVACGVLPLELKPCPTCAAMGLKCTTKPSRGFTWVDPSRMFDWESIVCSKRSEKDYGGKFALCRDCSMTLVSRIDRCGLLWVGEKYYPTPEDFDKESNKLGISRRLPHGNLPKGFKIGADFIMLAHRKSVLRVNTDIESGKLFDYFPGVFRIFRPDRIEYVVKGDEDDDFIDGLVERGVTPVKVERNE